MPSLKAIILGEQLQAVGTKSLPKIDNMNEVAKIMLKQFDKFKNKHKCMRSALYQSHENGLKALFIKNPEQKNGLALFREISRVKKTALITAIFCAVHQPAAPKHIQEYFDLLLILLDKYTDHLAIILQHYEIVNISIKCINEHQDLIKKE